MSTAIYFIHFFLSFHLFHVPCTAHDVISFNGQGQLCHLTCAGEKRFARVSQGNRRKTWKTITSGPENSN